MIFRHTLSRVMSRLAGLLACWLFPVIALAAENAEPKKLTPAMNDPMSSAYLTQLTVGLLIVILSIVVLAWVARRLNRFSASADGSMKVVGGLSMGTRERIVLVEVESTRLVLGVTPGRIQALHVMPQQQADEQDSNVAAFNEKLDSAMQAQRLS